MEPQRIAMAEVRQRLDSGEQLTIVDARSEDAWRKADRQIPGSLRVSPDDLEAARDRVPRDRAVITYCT